MTQVEQIKELVAKNCRDHRGLWPRRYGAMRS